jgi:hypothetical protein
MSTWQCCCLHGIDTSYALLFAATMKCCTTPTSCVYRENESSPSQKNLTSHTMQSLPTAKTQDGICERCSLNRTITLAMTVTIVIVNTS